jgi:hypothetical protein
MSWLNAIVVFFKAIIEGIKAAWIYDAGKTKEALRQMERAEDEISRAIAARNADSVSDDQDPYNRNNK